MYFEDYPIVIRQSIWLDTVHAMRGYAFKYGDVSDVIEEFSPSGDLRRMILSGDYHGVEFDPSDIPSALAALALDGDDATWDEIPIPVRTYRTMLRDPDMFDAVASSNRKRIRKKERVPIYSFGRQAAVSSNQRAIRTTAGFMRDRGYEPLDVIMIGEDPGTGDIVNLVIAQFLGDGGFHVIRVEDRSDRGRSKETVPYSMETIWSGYRREDAVQVESQERAKLLESYTWYIPGTKARIRGSRRWPGSGISSWPVPSCSRSGRPTPKLPAKGWCPRPRRRAMSPHPSPYAIPGDAAGSWRPSASPAIAG